MAGEEFYKKRNDGVVINNNKGLLNQARNMKQQREHDRKRVDIIESELNEIKILLKELLNRK